MPNLLSLSTELIDSIAYHCTKNELHSLMQTCWRLHNICKPALYKDNALFGHSSAAFFCFFTQHPTTRNLLSTLQAVNSAGGDINCGHYCPPDNALGLHGLLQPIHLAIYLNDIGVVGFLIHNEASLASSVQDLGRWVIEKGSDAMAQLIVGVLFQTGNLHKDALHWAVGQHRRQLAKWLMEFAAYNPNAFDGFQFTPLMCAIQNPVVEAGDFLQWFLSMGANPNLQSERGYPLTIACQFGRWDHAIALLDNGAKVRVSVFGQDSKNDRHCSNPAGERFRWSGHDFPYNGLRLPATEFVQRLLYMSPAIDISPSVREDTIEWDITAVGAPIDIVMDVTMSYLLSTRTGEPAAAQMLLQFGCRIPQMAISAIDTALKLIRLNNYTEQEINSEWPTLLRILPTVLSYGCDQVSTCNWYPGIANILHMYQER